LTRHALLNRRRFLLAGGLTLSGVAVSSSGFANFAPYILRRSRNPFHTADNPFQLGIAAGSPTADGFVLWTRLATDPLSQERTRPGGITAAMHTPGIVLDYEVAGDPKMRQIITSGSVLAERDYGFSVHLPIGGLAPGRPYWYRFHLGSATSAIGRATTLPLPGQPAARLRLGFASCANYERGYFSAYRHLAAEEPDLTIFLGDYIYEQVERHRSVLRRHSDGEVPQDLDGYRRRYAQYRMDPDLQALHAAGTTLATWDDHEVENDYAGAWSERFTPPAAFRAQRQAAYQAFYEHMPLRSRPAADGLAVHDCITYGDLARISLLDGRQHRDRGACYQSPDRGGGHLVDSVGCPELLDPTRSMLGGAQERWLAGNLRLSPARWNVMAQNVIMAPLGKQGADGQMTAWSDAWDGYPLARERLMTTLVDSHVRNPVVFSGDIHSFWQNDLTAHITSKAAAPIGTEFVVSSVTSDGPPNEHLQQHVAHHAHVHFADSRYRGYAVAEISGDEMLTHFRTVQDVTDPRSARGTLVSFVIADGVSGAMVA
jgi:alkaline phosphatase D